MSQVTQRFHIGDVLSITTGKLVSRDHMDGIYRILGFMTGENLMTHQLPRAMDEAQPYLLDQLPELRDVPVPESFADREAVESWLAEQAKSFGEWFTVRPIPEVARIPHDALEEAVTLMGGDRDRVIVGGAADA